MRFSTMRPRRHGLALWSVLVAALPSVFFAWVKLGFDEDARQRAAAAKLRELNGAFVVMNGVRWVNPECVGFDYLPDPDRKPTATGALRFHPRWPSLRLVRFRGDRRGIGWLEATPWWSSRWWISHLTDIEPPLGTVVEVDFAARRLTTDAEWEYFCRSFSRAVTVDIRCPVNDEQLRFLSRMPSVVRITFNNFDKHPQFTHGDGFNHLRGLGRLERLELLGVRLSGAGKKALGRLENLAALELIAWEETGDVVGGADDETVAHLERLKRLVSLVLGGPNLTDAGLGHVRKLASLEVLDIVGGAITDDGLRQLEGLRISDLSLDRTAVSDRGIPHLTRLPRLSHLSLEETRVTDAAIPELKKLTNLITLDLRATALTQAGCRELFAALPRLETLTTPDAFKSLRRERRQN